MRSNSPKYDWPSEDCFAYHEVWFVCLASATDKKEKKKGSALNNWDFNVITKDLY